MKRFTQIALLAVALWCTPYMVEAATTVFNSAQLAGSPTNTYVLTTDGTANAWTDPGTIGGSTDLQGAYDNSPSNDKAITLDDGDLIVENAGEDSVLSVVQTDDNAVFMENVSGEDTFLHVMYGQDGHDADDRVAAFVDTGATKGVELYGAVQVLDGNLQVGSSTTAGTATIANGGGSGEDFAITYPDAAPSPTPTSAGWDLPVDVPAANEVVSVSSVSTNVATLAYSSLESILNAIGTLTLSGTLTVDGTLNGSGVANFSGMTVSGLPYRKAYTFGLVSTIGRASQYAVASGSVQTSTTAGFVMPRSGSITACTVTQDTNMTPAGSWDIEVHVDGSNVWTAGTMADGSNEFELVATQAAGTDTVSAGSEIAVYLSDGGSALDITNVLITVEITE